MDDRPRRQVIPPPTMLPPPHPPESQRSSSSSSSRKRKRGGNPESISRASSGTSSDFTSAVKRRVEIIDDSTSCWHCGASPTDICHVIGKKDRMFPEIVEQGLITFDHLGHVDNAIPLCPLCHRNFDDINKPGLIFLPFLPYFIEFEERDFTQRERTARETGSVSPRTCPTPQMYSEHLVSTGQLPGEENRGGLYWRYTLQNFFPNLGQDNSWIPGPGPFQEPDSWHGAPMAAIWRGFLILGNPLCGLPSRQIKLLEELRDLYKRNISIDISSPHAILFRAEDSGAQHSSFERAKPSQRNQSASLAQELTFSASANEGLDTGDNGEAQTDSGIDLVSQRSRSRGCDISCKRKSSRDSGLDHSFRSSSFGRVRRTPHSSHLTISKRPKISLDCVRALPRARVRQRPEFACDSHEDLNASHRQSRQHEAIVNTVQRWIQECAEQRSTQEQKSLAVWNVSMEETH